MIRKHKKSSLKVHICVNDDMVIIRPMARIFLSKRDEIKYKSKPKIYRWQTGGIF